MFGHERGVSGSGQLRGGASQRLRSRHSAIVFPINDAHPKECVWPEQTGSSKTSGQRRPHSYSAFPVLDMWITGVPRPVALWFRLPSSCG